MYSPADTAQAAPARLGPDLGEALTTRVTVIGLGYVGLPLAVALAGRFETIGPYMETRRSEERARAIVRAP